MDKEFAVGQVWSYPHPEGFEDSRIIIGSIEPLEQGDDIICIAVLSAPVPRRQGQVSKATIPFLPFSRSAIDETVTELDVSQSHDLPDEFSEALEKWRNETAGRDFFQVPFPTLLSELYYALQDEEGMLNEKND